jgi:hypothetical protein
MRTFSDPEAFEVAARRIRAFLEKAAREPGPAHTPVLRA